MKIAFNPSTVAALIAPPNNKDITFDLRGHNIFARGVKFCGTDTNTWRDIKINNISIDSNILDLRNGSNTTLTNTNGVVTINSTWRPVVDNLTSDSTTSSLSAKQGKVLKALIDGKSNSDHNHDGRYYTKAESDIKYITDITTSVNKLTFTKNGSNIARDIIVNIVRSQGNLTNISDKNATTKASSGLVIYNSHNQVIGTNSYSSVLSINTGGTIQIAGNWGDDTARNLYWRSQSDRNVADYPWKSWRTILDNENYSSTLDSRYYTKTEVNNKLNSKLNYRLFWERTNIDLNNITEAWHTYEVNNITGTANTPTNASWHQAVQWGTGDRDYTVQLCTAYTSNYSLYLRHKIAGKWYDWIQLATTTDIPNSLKNPYALTISLNGTSQGPYDGSATKNINITPSSIGAATSDHNHDGNQLCRIYTFNVHNHIIKVGTLTSGQYGHVCKLRFNSGIGYNARNQDKTMTVVIRASNGYPNYYGFYFEAHSESYRGGEFTTFYLHQTSKTQCELYMAAFDHSGQSTYEVSFSNGDLWTNEISGQDALPTSNIFTLPNYQIAYTDYNVASATKVIVNQHTTNDTNYPLVWSNQPNTSNVTENQLYKSWADLYYNPKNKQLTVGGSVVTSSFIKSGGNENQLLRADGGVAAFNWSGQSGQPTWLWGGNNFNSYYIYNPSNFRVAYASSAGNADTAQYLRSLGNQNCQTGRTQAYGDVYTYNTIYTNTGAPIDFTSVIGFGRGTAGTVEIAGGWCNSHLYWRSLRDCCDDWYSWRTVLDSSNYTEFINNYYWANVKISASSSTTTSPTVSNLTATNSIRMNNISLEHTDEINNITDGNIHLNYRNSGNVSLCEGGGKVGIGTTAPSYKLDVNGDIWCRGALRVGSSATNNYIAFYDNSGNYDFSTRLQTSGNNRNVVTLPSESGTLALTSYGGDSSHPIFLGYLNLDHGNDGTIRSSFSCLGYSVSFTYTRGGNYCRIYIPNTTYQVFYIRAATASVNYSGGGMDAWVGTQRGDGAWWLHCYASGPNEVRVKGFCQNNSNNDGWWGGNPLGAENGSANKITVCIFGYVTFK